MIRRTKIVCTLGPATDTPAMIASLIHAGMNVARLNFSHGTHEEHRRRMVWIREASARLNTPVAILQDLSGPKIRVGDMVEPVILRTGDELTLTRRDVPGTAEIVSVTLPELVEQVHVGDTVLLADGYIELKVVAVDATDVRCRVIHGGMLDSHKGINLPRRSLDVPAMTEKDRDDLCFGLAEGVDYVAASFVRSAEDLLRIKAIMDQQGRRAPLIAKIEKHEALRAIVDILDNAEGLMVARGDLAVETAFERVPLVQKALIERCNKAGKLVITATQMLRSMVDNPRPTRAEAADVANAVLDGTDAVMLSEETAVGQYPSETVSVMDRIVRTAETRLASREHLPSEREEGHVTVPAAIGHVAATLARDLKATAILTPTQTGGSARRVSRFRPSVPIVAISTHEVTIRQLALIWGVIPILIPHEEESTDSLIEQAKRVALANGIVHAGDIVIVAAGIPSGIAKSTNMIKIDTIGAQ
ncbi:MAG: pyruvate kinase [Chloroflexota bacterium]